ncbi:MAG: phage holin family protein [Nocardioides sp.]
MRFLVRLVSTAAALALATWLLGGMSIEGDTWQEQIVPLLLVALIMGVIGAIVKPVVTFLSLPFVILTLGLFLLVINAWMLMLAGWVAGKADIGFEVDGFWTALLGSIIITLTTSFFDAVLEDRR